MLFNFGKCKCLQTEHGNEDVQHTMGDTVLSSTIKEKDLVLIISADMNVSEQCGIAAAICLNIKSTYTLEGRDTLK